MAPGQPIEGKWNQKLVPILRVIRTKMESINKNQWTPTVNRASNHESPDNLRRLRVSSSQTYTIKIRLGGVDTSSNGKLAAYSVQPANKEEGHNQLAAWPIRIQEEESARLTRLRRFYGIENIRGKWSRNRANESNFRDLSDSYRVKKERQLFRWNNTWSLAEYARGNARFVILA